jgi:hypothetical protein
MPMQLDKTRDPLVRFRDGAWIARGDRAMPLVDTTIDVRILGGLAIVRTARIFVNVEDRSIEATITFPVPVHATIVALTAAVDGRLLVGRAQRRQAARETYEGAIDAGKTAVLHEEALRGVHVLSVGHIPPGKEIAVTSTWAMPLSRHGCGATLRIPVTVGDIFGHSPLPDSDDLIHGPAPQSASLTVTCDPGVAAFRDATLINGSARVLLDRPIDLVLPNWTARALRGVGADGRMVTLDIVPAGGEDAPIDAVLLLDQSGSMAEAAGVGYPEFGGAWGARSKHQVMVEGVSRMMGAMRPRDVVRLWQFNTVCEPVASLAGLWGANGGTSIGAALAAVVRHSDARDIAIVTDGKSHDVDVQALARSGRRFTAILVGEDSLDAYVGHLAALTGGQIFVVPGHGSAQAIMAACDAMRRPHVVQKAIAGAPVEVVARSGGMEIRARWSQDEDGATAIDGDNAGVIGAVAAAMAIPHMAAAEAADLAEAHGIVCHLTSLVMVDEAAEAQEGIPAQRKVALMTPATARAAGSVRQRFGQGGGVAEAPARATSRRARIGAGEASGRNFDGFFRCGLSTLFEDSSPFSVLPPPSLRSLVTEIDWSKAEALRQGDVASLSPAQLAIIEEASKFEAVAALGVAVKAAPVVVVIALLAKIAGDSDRNAARLFRAVLCGADQERVAAVMRELGL